MHRIWARLGQIGLFCHIKRAAGVLLFVALCVVATPAHGKRGALTLSAQSDQEWLRLRPPVTNAGAPFARQSIYVPRFGLSVSYGATERLWLGIVCRVSLPRSLSLQTPRAPQTSSADTALVTRYHDILSTLQFGLAVIDDRHFFLEIVAEGGVSLRHWRAAHSHLPNDGVSFGDRENPALHVRPWKKAPYVRAGASARVRPATHWVLSVSPYAATTFARDVALGATVDVAFSLPVESRP